ncbi:MAG: tape measure protein [Microcoleus sp.]
MIDNVRLRLAGQKELIPQARADRLQKRVANINRRESEQSIATADAAILEIGNRQTDEENKKVRRDNTRTARQTQATQREIEKKFDLPREADREIILDDSGDEGAIKSAIGTVRNSLKSVRDAITERLREQAKTVSNEAKTTLTDIRTNRLDAEAKAFDNPAAADRAKKLKALETRTEKATTGIDELTGKETLSSKDRAKLRDLKAEINSVYKEIGKPLPSGSNSLLDIGDRIGGLVSKFKGLGVALLALPFAFDALQALKQFGRDSVDAAVQFDRLRTSLSFSSGSAGAADRDLAFVDQQASTNGTDLRTGREGFASLRAATRNTAVEGEGAKNLFEGLTQASTVLGLSTEKQQKAFLALEQVASKGKLSAEELRGQLGEALPGAFGIAARSIGVTETELNKLLETGAITANEFLPKFAQQLKSEFGGAAETASDNLQSSLFRVNNAFLKLQEATGAAISPAVKTGADALAAAVGLLADKAGSLIQIGAVLAAGFFGKGLLNANLPIAGIVDKLGELRSINIGSIGKGFGAIADKASAAAKALAPIALEFIAIQGVIQLFSTAKDLLGLTDEGENFKRLADTAEKELDRIKGKAGEVKDSLRSPSKGFDLTFGLGDLAGVGAFRTDDLLKGTQKKEENPILDIGKKIAAAPFQPAIALNKLVTKFRGGEGVTTIGDLQKQRESVEFSRFSESLDNTAGLGFDTAKISDSLRAQKAAEDRVKTLRGQRATLAGQPGKATEIAAIDREIKAATRERDVAAKPAADIQRAVSGGLSSARAELKKIQDKGNNATKEDEQRIGVIQDNIRNLEAAQKNLDRLGLKFGTTGDATRKLITTLADLDNKLASIAEKADLKLNINLAGNAKQALSEFGTNQFASQDGAVKDAIAQQERAKTVFEETRKAVEDAKKALSGEDVQRELDQISVGATGRKLTLDSSAEDLKTAKDGADPKQKDLIERLENFRKVRAQVPILDREASQSELASKQAKQAAELARIDDSAEQKSIQNKRDSVARQIDLNNDLVRNTIKSDEDLAMKRAELEKASITDRSASVQAQIGELESLRERGVISAEEYVKRRRALAGEELQIASDASNAEVALREAANAKILKGIERRTRDRNLASKISSNEAQIGIVKDSLDPNVSNQELAVRSAGADLNSTRSELSNTKAELEDLTKAFEQGALKEEEYKDKAAVLKGSISDLGLKEAQAELALRKAINDQILKQYELAKQTRDVGARVAANEGRAALVRRQLNSPVKMESEDVAIESARLDTAATDRQIANANRDLADLQEQFSRGLIKVDEFQSKSLDLKGTLSDLSVQKLNNQLAEVEARNAKILKQFEMAKQARDIGARIAGNEGRGALVRRQLTAPRKLESDDVAIESAQLDTAATDRQIANAEKDLADLEEKLSRGLITTNEFKSQSLELKGTLSDLSVQRLNNELAEVEARNAKILKQFERSVTLANAQIDKTAGDQTFAAKQSQLETGTGDSASEAIKIEQQAIRERIKLKQSEIVGVKKLVEDRVITENEGVDRILAAESDLRSQRMALLDSQIEEYNRAADSQIASVNRVAAAQQRAFDRQKTQLTQLTTLLEKQSAVTNAEKDLAGAVSAGRVGALEGALSKATSAREGAARLRSGEAGETERKVLQRQFGLSEGEDANEQELRLLDQQQSLAREIEAEKLRGLEESQKFARELLAQDQQRLKIAQQISEIEARGAELAAKSALTTAKLELAKAKRTGDRESIAAASEGVAAASEGLSSASQNTKFVQALGASLDKELELRRKGLQQTQSNERKDLIRQSDAAEGARQREQAQAIDRAGLSGQRGVKTFSLQDGGGGPINAPTGGITGAIESTAQYQTRHLDLMQKLIDATVSGKAPRALDRAPSPEKFAKDEAAMANTTKTYYVPSGAPVPAQDNANDAKYQSDQLSTLREIVTAIRQQKPSQTNVFQGGQDSVQQYMSVSKARQSATKQ